MISTINNSYLSPVYPFALCLLPCLESIKPLSLFIYRLAEDGISYPETYYLCRSNGFVDLMDLSI